MYAEEDLTRARRAIEILAMRDDVPEEKIRSDLQEAITCSYPAAHWDRTKALDLFSDCTPTEFIILYENMASLKKLLCDHV